MFSVGASPFNSKDRQLYGGWTADQAQGNLWGLYKANSMQARYGPPGPATDAAKLWMKNWRKASKENPRATRAALRASAGDWLKQRKRKPLSAEQKHAILADWNSIPFVISPESAYNVGLVSGATYPSWRRLMLHPELTYPYDEPDPAMQGRESRTSAQILGTPDAYYNDYNEYRQALRDRLREMRARRGAAARPPDDFFMMINQAMPDSDRHGALAKFEF